MNVSLCMLYTQRKSSAKTSTEHNTKQDQCTHDVHCLCISHEVNFSEQLNDYKFCLPCSKRLHHSQLCWADFRRKQHWQCFEARVMESCLRCISSKGLEICAQMNIFTFANVANQMVFCCICILCFLALKLMLLFEVLGSGNYKTVFCFCGNLSIA